MKQFTHYGTEFRPGTLKPGTKVLVPYDRGYAAGVVRLYGQDEDSDGYYFVELYTFGIGLWYRISVVAHVIEFEDNA